MNNDLPIGRVVATERNPTTTGQVRFWLEPDVELKPFDFVRLTAPENTNRDIGVFYAIIHEIQQVSDEPSPLSGFVSADFGNSQIEPRIARVVATYADAAVLFNTHDIEMPIPHGSQVHWPDEDGVRQALGILDYNRSTPAGYITMSGPGQSSLTIPVDMDADYLIGPEGAHLNISGISGLATKTSYAMFLLSAIQQKQETEWAAGGGDRAAFVILNVKGVDLLSLHEEALDLDEKDTRANWEKCGLTATPLKKRHLFLPVFRFRRLRTRTDEAQPRNSQPERQRGKCLPLLLRCGSRPGPSPAPCRGYRRSQPDVRQLRRLLHGQNPPGFPLECLSPEGIELGRQDP